MAHLEGMECLHKNLGRDSPLEITGGRGGRKLTENNIFKAQLTAGFFFPQLHDFF